MINNIEADKNQFIQIITNLIINARDAMPKGGSLIFKTENVSVNKDTVKHKPEFIPGKYVKIIITDTGIGIARDIIDNIFEPFFSTKGEGKGTGLGLATVYGIVKNHNGHIEVESFQEKGTVFTIFFPVSTKRVIKKKKKPGTIRGDATILVVDDEIHIRNLARRMLNLLGYKVLLAKDGLEALDIFSRKNNKIDLILLDMIMPKMDGRETNLELRKIDPGIKVLLSSGFSQNGLASDIMNEGVSGFIQKPFKMYELSKVINDILK